ncbi:MAG: response regulator [Elusimicrobia bacterium]|nr:response regulator [Elusimicrobiota bacterium]
MKLLIVDDSGTNREILRRNLRGEGVEVLEAEDGLAALETLKTSKPDAIVSDILMPNLDGYSFCRAVRGDPALKDLPFVIYTSTYISPEDETLAARCGADKYMQKPAPFPELFAAIRGLIGEKTAARRPAEPGPPSEEDVLKQYSQVLIRKLEKKNLELQQRGDALQRLGRLRDTFGYFATPEVADFVLSHPLDYWKRSERRTLTVLFADIREFTPFMEASPPEEAVAALTEVFEFVDEAVRLEGGILNKFLGDGILAIFGAPLPNREHAAAAARAALRLRASMETLSGIREQAGLKPLRLGIGINTGEVIAGCIGTRARTEYTVIGHPVNLSARIEQIAEPGRILLGPATAELLGPGFKLESRGATNLKGVAEPVELWELL